jgi:carbamoylphosphate synthase large subunit
MNKSILITSVGSLVGQNVLDSLQHRRENLIIIGTNSIAEAANNFRCDKSYLVDAAAEGETYINELVEIIEKEKPDLVIPGRDDDVVILAQLSKSMPAYSDHFIVGSEHFAKAMDDKAKSYVFASKYNLPFSPTVQSGIPGAEAKVQALVNEFGFPFIAKPSKGNGSRGIWVVVNENQLNEVIKQTDFSIQPYFDHPKSLELDTRFGLPFFWEIPEHKLFAAQVIINKNRQIDGIFGFISMMVGGKCERMDKHDDPELLQLVRKFAEAAIKEDWRGPFNIQLKKDPKYGFRVIEMNGRFSGGTSARYYLGFDEVAITINDWIGEEVVPTQMQEGVNVVTKILSDFEIVEAHIDTLEKEKVWSRKRS